MPTMTRERYHSLPEQLERIKARPLHNGLRLEKEAEIFCVRCQDQRPKAGSTRKGGLWLCKECKK